MPAETEFSEGNADSKSESQSPPLRDSSPQLFCSVYSAASYLDEQIVNYFNGGTPGIEIYFQLQQGEEYKLKQIAYYSRLYNALCGYGSNLTASIHDEGIIIQDGGNDYRKYTFNIESTLSDNQIEQARYIASTIADDANQIQGFDEKIEYIVNEIYDRISYHHECYAVVNSTDPYDKCDTAYSLHEGNAICTGFTGAFCLVCYEAGLDAVPITGYVRQPSDTIGGGHAWNIIKNGNTWLQVDCTFGLSLFGTDGVSTRGVSGYFTEMFKQNHKINTSQNAWVQTNSGKSYVDQNGYSVADKWLLNSGHMYYFEMDGCMVASKWRKISEKWYYFKSSGHMATNEWAQDSHGWCWMDSDGHITKSQWVQTDGYWYYLKSSGYRAESEWAQDNTDWCYLGSDGKMVTSAWAQDSVGWCYLNGSGHLTRSQLVQSNGYWYYLKSDGHMATNEWAQDSHGWCYMDNNGHITKSQWLHYNGYWYYLKSNGYMATSEWIEDSVGWCYLGSNGRMVTNDWVQDSAGWCYMDSTGHKTRSAWIQKNGYWYYLKANGYMAVNEWAIDSNGYCWMDSNGHWVTGTKWIGSPRTIGSSYIISGHRVNSATINIDGYDCTFNGAGQLTTFVYNPGVNPGTQ